MEERWPAIVAGTTKMPEAMMALMWIARPSGRPKARRSWGSLDCSSKWDLVGSNSKEAERFQDFTET